MCYWYKSINLLKLKTGFIYYKSPMNQTYWWNFGGLALCFLIVQILTGLFLAMYYDPSILKSYSSIMYINNEIYYVNEYKYEEKIKIFKDKIKY